MKLEPGMRFAGQMGPERMTALAGTELDKPGTGDSFEVACTTLWRCILGAEVKRYGRQGQNQDGIDHYGHRSPTGLVAIQCKKRDYGKPLSETAFREIVQRALDDELPFTEFYVCTTAKDDAVLDKIAIEITLAQKKAGRNVEIHHWGWQTIQERAKDFTEAIEAFDPTYGAGARRIEAKIDENSGVLHSIAEQLLKLAPTNQVFPAPFAFEVGRSDSVEAHLDAEIDGYRELAAEGKPKAAHALLMRLLSRLGPQNSGRLFFRVKATIGHCVLAIGDEEQGLKWIEEAIAHAPNEPKAVSNKIFLHIVRKEYQAAFDAAKFALAGESKSVNAAALLVQAASLSNYSGDPMAYVPEEFVDAPDVLAAQIAFQRSKASSSDWWAAAKTAYAKHSQNKHLKQFAAEAELDEVLKGHGYRERRSLSETDRATVLRSAETLSELWKIHETGEVPSNEEAVGSLSNAIVAYAVLGDAAEVVRLAESALRTKQTHPTVMEMAVAALIDQDQFDLAARCIEFLPDGEATNVFKVARAFAIGELEEAVKIVESGRLPRDELQALAVIPELVALFRNASSTHLDQWAKLIDKSNDIRTLSLVGTFASKANLDSVAELAFGKAISIFDDKSAIAPERQMLAELAARLRRWRDMVGLLDEITDKSQDDPWLRRLAIAHANAFPVLQASVQFFEELPEGVRALEFYAGCAASSLYNSGRVADAASEFLNVMRLNPKDTHALLGYLSCLHRLGRDSELAGILSTVSIASLSGEPAELMSVAHAIRDAGRFEDALQLGYSLLRKHPRIPEMALGYVGLILGEKSQSIIPKASTVQIDTWFVLTNAAGDKFAYWLEQSPTMDDAIMPSHPMASAVIGKLVGDEVTTENAIGVPETWTIREIKSKYLHALHETLEKFESRFPDATGLVRVSVKDGNVDPVLEMAQKRSVATQRAAEAYRDGKTTLAAISRQLGGSSIDFASYVRGLDWDVRTSLGNSPERSAGISVAREFRSKGIVLDTYTAWAAAYLDMLGVLRSWFGKLILPATSLDTVNISIKEIEESVGTMSGTLAWRDGQHLFLEGNDESRNAQLIYLRNMRERIVDACDVVAVVVPSTVSQKLIEIAETLGGGVFDPLFVAANEKVPLLTEDLLTRDLARLSNIQGTWLQPTLMAIRDTGIVSTESYAEGLVGLGELRHSHLTLDTPSLVSTFKRDQSVDLAKFRALTRFIWNKNADLPSHVAVVAAALKEIWPGHRNPSLRVRAAIPSLLENLVRYHHATAPRLLAELIVRTKSSKGLAGYIEGWATKQGFSVRAIRKRSK